MAPTLYRGERRIEAMLDETIVETSSPSSGDRLWCDAAAVASGRLPVRSGDGCCGTFGGAGRSGVERSCDGAAGIWGGTCGKFVHGERDGGDATLPLSFGDLLRERRVEASLTQEQLAELCHLSPKTIAALEQGRRRTPRLSTVKEIADALGLDEAARTELARAATGGASDFNGSPGFCAPGFSEVPLGDLSPTSRRIRLPTPVTPLIGRRAAIDEIGHKLAVERLVCLIGPGGVGKTRLAVGAALAASDQFPGGTCWVELGGLAEPAEVAPAFIRALGGNDQPLVMFEAQLLALVPVEPLLVVADNCEHLLDAAASSIAAVVGNPTVTVLATSREPLAIPGEVVCAVPPLDIPAAPSDGVAATAATVVDVASVALFVERAARVRAGYAISDRDAGDVARICRRLQGIPLAIELIATRMWSVSVEELANELEAQLDLSHAEARGVPDRLATLEASVAWSYRLLSAEEQVGFRCLAAAIGPTSTECFRSMTARRGLAQPAAVLAALSQKSLLTFDRTDGSRHWFSVLETIRTYAVDRAKDAGDLDLIREAHAEYMNDWLGRLDTGDADDETLDELTVGYPGFRAALTASIASASPRAAELVARFGVGWHQLNKFRDAVALGDDALAIVNGADRATWSRAVSALAMSRLLAGDVGFVMGPAVEAVDTARLVGDQRSESWCRLVIGFCPPFWPAHLRLAHELAGEVGSPMLAALASAALSIGGTEADGADLLRQMAANASTLANQSLLAVCTVAESASLTERGQLDSARELAWSVALNPDVMPGLRLIAIGQVLEVAFIRADLDAVESIMATRRELARLWPVGGWHWYEVNDLRLPWLRGERPHISDMNSLHWTVRLGAPPISMRDAAAAGLDGGQEVDIAVLCKMIDSPQPGSLLDASISAIRGERALRDGDRLTGTRLWASALAAALVSGYRLVAIDALEALGCVATSDAKLELAAALFASAQAEREAIGYRWRFTGRQRSVNAASAAVEVRQSGADVRSLAEAGHLALTEFS
jgi:predicted ATPase/transcriptional regulator with XRE-family HTH domain